MNLRALKWLAIVFPVAFLVAVEYLRGILFPHALDGIDSRVFFFATAAVAVALFSHGVFTVIDRLQEALVRQNEQLSALNRIATASAEPLGVQPLLGVGLEEVLGALSADAGLICTVDLERGEHSAVASRGFSGELVRSMKRARLCDDPIALQVVETGRPVVIDRLLDDPRFAEVAEREGVRSAISYPLKSRGETTGIMAIASRTERWFGDVDQELLGSVAAQLGMAISQWTAFERSLERNRETEALLAVSSAVTSSLDLNHVLDRALQTILDNTSAEAAEIWLVDEDCELAFARHSGSSPEAFHEALRLRMGDGLPGLAAARRAPVTTHDLGRDSRFIRTSVTEAGFQTYCALPLVLRDEPLGVLGVAARDPDAVTRPEELRLLEGISEVISVAIENARLYERIQDSAVLEERERIAREMHDGLAQILTYVNAQSLAVSKLLASDRTAEAREELAKMEAAVREVYADVREAILGLRASPRMEGGLVVSLASYLDQFTEMTGIETRLEVGDGVESPRLSSFAEIQLVRIVQEALSNIRKHARARSATVALHCLDDGVLQVVVSDDGRGFDPDQVPRRGWPRFGLQTMRERAEAVGGSLRIQPRDGGGTAVLIELVSEEARTPTSLLVAT